MTTSPSPIASSGLSEVRSLAEQDEEEHGRLEVRVGHSEPEPRVRVMQGGTS